jgi:hypothetical protein
MNKLALAIVLVASPSMALDLPYETTGTSRMKEKSLPNSLVAAHFVCNKKGLWADLDTMEVGNTVSDRSRRPTYRTTVRFECSPDYQKDLPVEE